MEELAHHPNLAYDAKVLAVLRHAFAVEYGVGQPCYELEDFVDKYESSASIHADSEDERKLINEIYEISLENNYFNETIRGQFIKHKQELMNSEIFVTFANNSNYIPDDMVNLTVDYMLVRKLIRPSVKAVFKLKKETIFNIIPEENESNEN